MAWISVDIDVYDVLDNLSNREKQELADELYDAGYIPWKLEKNEQEPVNVHDELWFEAVNKIRQGRLQLTLEQEKVIMSIAKSL